MANSKTAAALDKACLTVEKEFSRFLKALHAAREAARKHYSKTQPTDKPKA